MDGDVDDEQEPSEEEEQHESVSLTEIFNEAFPQYLFMGMSYEEYWRGKPGLVRAYRKAWKMKREERNWEMWMQGAYFYNALLCVAPVMRAALSKEKVEPGKYMDAPFPLTEKEAQEQEIARERAETKRMLAKMEADSARELKRRKEAEEVSDNGGTGSEH